MAASASLPAGWPALAQPSTLGAAALRTLDARIDAAIAERRLPGGVLWIERLGAEPYRRVYGQRAWEPAPEPLAFDAVFDAASLTKPVVTGTLMAQWIERGRLGLDDPVRRHLPEFTAGDGITLRHLLTHSSGLPAILPLQPAWSGAPAGVALALAARAAEPPGQVFRYSDVNYILLGHLIERIGGAPLHEQALSQVLQPLAMQDSGFLPLARHAMARLVPTEFDGTAMLRGVVHDPAARRMGGVAGHAGLFATAADLARYARMVLGGGVLDGVRVLASPSLAAMTADQSLPGQPARGIGWDIDSPYSRPRGALYPRGTGFGHTGFTGCALWIDPGSKSFYVWLSNRVHPRGSESIVALYEEIGTQAARAVGLSG